MEPEDKVRTGDTGAAGPGSAGVREGRGLLCVQRPKGRYEQVQCVRHTHPGWMCVSPPPSRAEPQSPASRHLEADLR